MNKFGKTIYRIGIAFLIIGLVITIIGAAFGGKIVNNIKFGDTDFTESYTDVTSIQIEYDAGQLDILKGDSFRIEAKNIYKDGFSSSVEDGVWTIKNKFLKSKYWFGIFPFNGLNWGENATKVTIYIPEDALLEKCNLELGAGKVSIDSLNTDSLGVKVGAGEVIVKNLNAKDTRLECGAGSIKIDGEITGDSVVKNGAGDIKLDLKGSIEDYDYRIKVGLGSAIINDKSYSGSSDTNVKNPDSTGNFEIDCGLGQVVLLINE